MQTEHECYICGRKFGLEEHHVFAGQANRRISERLGLKVYLCHEHHTGDQGAQYDAKLNRLLKQDAQVAFEKTHSRHKWMELIGKNYLKGGPDNDDTGE